MAESGDRGGFYAFFKHFLAVFCVDFLAFHLFLMYNNEGIDTL
jgi:endo-1,4-beta-mannosidase